MEHLPEVARSEDRMGLEVRREGLTMALYVSLSQVAVMTVLTPAEATATQGLALMVALTSVGLVLAHQVAFRLSSRLVEAGSGLTRVSRRQLRAQVAGGTFVTVIAVVPILVFGPGAYRWSIAALLVFVMVVGYQAARASGHSRARSLVDVAAVAVIVVGVLVVKTLVSH